MVFLRVVGKTGVIGATGPRGQAGFAGDIGDTGATGVQQPLLVKRRVTRQVPRCPGDTCAKCLCQFDYYTFILLR